MKLLDTHAHLQFEKFDADREEVVKRVSQAMEAVIMPGSKLDNSESGIKLAQSVPNFYASIGVHPHHDKEWDETWLAELEKLITKDKVVAVGEIGLDKYLYKGYPEPDIKSQLAIFLPQVELALKYKKPLLFHCREAYDDLYQAIKPYAPLVGLIHCFMGDKEIAKKFVDLGLLISFAGNLTYKGNDHMREAALYLPEDKIVVETDSPYLTPEPIRGQRNEPMNTEFVVKTIAEMKNYDPEKVAEFTTTNAKKLFSL